MNIKNYQLKNNIYIWCSDYNPNSGEGILANKFVNDLKNYNKNYNYKIIKPKTKIFKYLRILKKNQIIPSPQIMNFSLHPWINSIKVSPMYPAILVSLAFCLKLRFETSHSVPRNMYSYDIYKEYIAMSIYNVVYKVVITMKNINVLWQKKRRKNRSWLTLLNLVMLLSD